MHPLSQHMGAQCWQSSACGGPCALGGHMPQQQESMWTGNCQQVGSQQVGAQHVGAHVPWGFMVRISWGGNQVTEALSWSVGSSPGPPRLGPWRSHGPCTQVLGTVRRGRNIRRRALPHDVHMIKCSYVLRHSSFPIHLQYDWALSLLQREVGQRELVGLSCFDVTYAPIWEEQQAIGCASRLGQTGSRLCTG